MGGFCLVLSLETTNFMGSPLNSPGRRLRRSVGEPSNVLTSSFFVNSPVCIFNQVCYKHCKKLCSMCFSPTNEAKEKPIEQKREVVLTPNYRVVSSSSSSGNFHRPMRYITEKNQQAEYDCTARDCAFLDMVKKELISEGVSQDLPSYRDIEYITDAIERLGFEDSLISESIQSLKNRRIKNVVQRCSICLQYREEYLVQCSICKIVVHLDCYRYSRDTSEGSWLCDWCHSCASQDVSTDVVTKPSCALCSGSYGALKQTDKFGVWCHVVCFENHPNTKFDTETCMITGLDDIPIGYCNLCNETSGSPIKCMEDSCTTSIHISCGHQLIQQLQAFYDYHNTGDIDYSPDALLLRCSKCAWENWIRNTVKGNIKPILSSKQYRKINSYIKSIGGIPQTKIILSIFIHYWLLIQNPTYPEKYLLSSLYIERNVKQQKEKWELENKKYDNKKGKKVKKGGNKKWLCRKYSLPTVKKRRNTPKQAIRCWTGKTYKSNALRNIKKKVSEMKPKVSKKYLFIYHKLSFQ